MNNKLYLILYFICIILLLQCSYTIYVDEEDEKQQQKNGLPINLIIKLPDKQNNIITSKASSTKTYLKTADRKDYELEKHLKKVISNVLIDKGYSVNFKKDKEDDQFNLVVEGRFYIENNSELMSSSSESRINLNNKLYDNKNDIILSKTFTNKGTERNTTINSCTSGCLCSPSLIPLPNLITDYQANNMKELFNNSINDYKKFLKDKIPNASKFEAQKKTNIVQSQNKQTIYNIGMLILKTKNTSTFKIQVFYKDLKTILEDLNKSNDYSLNFIDKDKVLITVKKNKFKAAYLNNIMKLSQIGQDIGLRYFLVSVLKKINDKYILDIKIIDCKNQKLIANPKLSFKQSAEIHNKMKIAILPSIKEKNKIVMDNKKYKKKNIQLKLNDKKKVKKLDKRKKGSQFWGMGIGYGIFSVSANRLDNSEKKKVLDKNAIFLVSYFGTIYSKTLHFGFLVKLARNHDELTNDLESDSEFTTSIFLFSFKPCVYFFPFTLKNSTNTLFDNLFTKFALGPNFIVTCFYYNDQYMSTDGFGYGITLGIGYNLNIYKNLGISINLDFVYDRTRYDSSSNLTSQYNPIINNDEIVNHIYVNYLLFYIGIERF